MKKILVTFLAFIMLFGLFGSANAQNTATFTLEELAAFNGQNGAKAYIAVNGIVYDVTNVPAWNNGTHNGQYAGNDVTEAIAKAPHGTSKLEGLTEVGVLVNGELSYPELAAFNGKDGNKAYIAVNGLIYDVTDDPSWTNGEHMGAFAGTDTTASIMASNHGVAKLEGLTVVAKVKDFTLEELAANNGKDGKPAYIAVDGMVYDVTENPAWANGAHNGVEAGMDVSEAMKSAPHGTAKLEGLTLIGLLAK